MLDFLALSSHYKNMSQPIWLTEAYYERQGLSAQNEYNCVYLSGKKYNIAYWIDFLYTKFQVCKTSLATNENP